MGLDTQNILLIINDGPYGNERPFNALRLALNVVKRPEVSVRIFLTGDGVACARRGQKTPNGYYNVERMVKSLARRGEVAVRETCSAARGLGPEDLALGVLMGGLDLETDWVLAADQLLVFQLFCGCGQQCSCTYAEAFKVLRPFCDTRC